LLKFKEPHLLGARLEMKINLPVEGESEISAVAEIVRVKACDKAKEYWAGVKFIEIREEDRKKILHFIKFIKNKENAPKT
ncbi:MAG: PilZ domain-containing protein, partial [Candidatus Omnitrophica bacterium]|nr:PilZ domain-containing protein [Candidatus Omnitrophota bacterium]